MFKIKQHSSEISYVKLNLIIFWQFHTDCKNLPEDIQKKAEDRQTHELFGREVVRNITSCLEKYIS